MFKEYGTRTNQKTMMDVVTQITYLSPWLFVLGKTIEGIKPAFLTKLTLINRKTKKGHYGTMSGMPALRTPILLGLFLIGVGYASCAVHNEPDKKLQIMIKERPLTQI